MLQRCSVHNFGWGMQGEVYSKWGDSLASALNCSLKEVKELLSDFIES
jgi:hypothetical protein